MPFQLAESEMAAPKVSIDHWRATPEDTIRLGVEAAGILARLKPYLEHRRASVLQLLIQHHRADTLTEGLMRSGIAALSELAALESDLGRSIRHGEQEVTATPTPRA